MYILSGEKKASVPTDVGVEGSIYTIIFFMVFGKLSGFFLDLITLNVALIW